MERKVYEAEIKRFTGEGKGTAVLARIGARDKDGDVLVRGLLGGSEQQVPLIQSHQWQLPPIGRALAREQGDELVADFALNLDSAGGREWASVLKFDLERGPLQQWSWAFSVLPGGAESGMHEGQPVRFLKRVQLHEVSPVLVAASVGSRTLALKEGIPDQATFAAMEARVRALRLPPEPAAARDDGRIWWKVSTDIPGWDGRRRAALEYAVLAAKELGVPPPRVFFYRRAATPEQRDFSTAGECTGVSNWAMRPGEIGIYEGVLSERALADTVGHEVFHHAHPAADEAAAGEFGRAFASRHSKILPAPRRSGGFTLEQLVAITQVIRSGLPIPR